MKTIKGARLKNSRTDKASAPMVPAVDEVARQQAFVVLGLPTQATRDEITRRYDILTRKMKSDPAGPEAAARDDIEAAYQLLAGITYHDPEAEKRLRERDARPGLFARLLHMEQTKLDNLVHYYRWPAFGALAGVALLVWILATTVFRPPYDFVMLLAGSVYVEDQAVLERQLMENLPDTGNPMISVVYFDEQTDSQMLSAVAQKLVVEVGYGENDLLIVDRAVFDQYAEQGAFGNLDALLARYGTTAEAQAAQRTAVLPDAMVEGDDAMPHVYGIDVTNSRFLKEAGVFGSEMIAVFGLKSGFPEKGDAVMQLITAP